MSTANTQIVILGIGTPVPDPKRQGPALAIVVGNTSYLVDCGTGCVRQATAAYQNKGVTGLQNSALQTLFISHLHSDHTLGYADLILTPWDNRKNAAGDLVPLTVYGPTGTIDMTKSLLAAFVVDTDVRIAEGKKEGQDLASTLNPVVIEIPPLSDGAPPALQPIFSDANVTVSAFQVYHGLVKPSYGFKLETKNNDGSPDKTIIISGDRSPKRVDDSANPYSCQISPDDPVVLFGQDADFLIHEVYAYAKYYKAPEAKKDYLTRYHTSTYELAQIALKTNPKLLIPIHKLGVTEYDTGGPNNAFSSAITQKWSDGSQYTGKVANTWDLDIYY